MSKFNFNQSIIGGRLTADVELKTTTNGTPVCSFTVAVTRKANREKTDFINCIAWRSTAEFIYKYFRKGSSICVTGEIQTRSWTDNNGNKKYATELVVDDVRFVDSKSENSAPSYGAPAYGDTNGYEDLSSDDELPF
jgi:single-strand DNA-binding protein